MSDVTLRERYVRRFMGLERYSRVLAWSVVFSYVLQVVLAVVAGHYLLTFAFSIWQVLAAIAIAVFIGTRLRGLNNIVHECSHSSFADIRSDNVTIGRFCSAILTGCFKTYRDDHLSHHAHLGDYDHDREMEPIEKFGLHEPLSLRVILRLFFIPLTGRHLSVYSAKNLSGDDGKLFFAFKIAILIFFAVFSLIYPMTSVIFVLIPFFFIFPTLNFWTDCLDHAGLIGETDELRASRNILASTLPRLLFFPRNDCYHLVHHLFPQIPARHLADAHKELCEDQEYRQEPLASKPLMPKLIPSLSASQRSRSTA